MLFAILQYSIKLQCKSIPYYLLVFMYTIKGGGGGDLEGLEGNDYERGAVHNDIKG